MQKKNDDKIIREIDDMLECTGKSERIHILNMIAENLGPNSIKDVIYEEGTGVRISYKNMHRTLLIDILEYLETCEDKYKFKYDEEG